MTNFLSDKLEELYKKESYAHPLQTKIKPNRSITGESPDEDDVGLTIDPGRDEEETKQDLGLKGNEKDLGNKGTKKDLGNKTHSDPKKWEFKGPRVSIHQEK
jgi:hypothetical protein